MVDRKSAGRMKQGLCSNAGDRRGVETIACPADGLGAVDGVHPAHAHGEREQGRPAALPTCCCCMGRPSSNDLEPAEATVQEDHDRERTWQKTTRRRASKVSSPEEFIGKRKRKENYQTGSV